jgi:hypothetical protein
VVDGVESGDADIRRRIKEENSASSPWKHWETSIISLKVEQRHRHALQPQERHSVSLYDLTEGIDNGLF